MASLSPAYGTFELNHLKKDTQPLCNGGTEEFFKDTFYGENWKVSTGPVLSVHGVSCTVGNNKSRRVILDNVR